MTTSNVTQKGQVTIPADMRKALGLGTGAKVRFSRQGRKLMLEAVVEPAAESLFGSVKAGRGIADIDAELDKLRTARSPVARQKRRK